MNAVRNRVIEDMKPYLDFAKHKDLIAISIGADYFTYDSVNDTDDEADFYEVIAVIEKEWLFEVMRKDGIENPLEYLQDVYTWDDSYMWFEKAKTEGKVAVVEFSK